MADWLLVVAFSVLVPQSGGPSFAFVLNTGPLPNEDEGWNLVGAGRCQDILGTQFDVECLSVTDNDSPLRSLCRRLLGRPYVVSLNVDLNRISPADLLATMDRIRSGWDPRKKAHFVFRLARCEDVIPGQK